VGSEDGKAVLEILYKDGPDIDVLVSSVEFIQKKGKEATEMADRKDAPELADFQPLYDTLEALISYLGKIYPRLKVDKLVTIMYNKTKGLTFNPKDEVFSEATESRNVSEIMSRTFTRTSDASARSSRSSIKDAYDILTLNLCSTESSVTINPGMVVACLHLLPQGDLVVDAKT